MFYTWYYLSSLMYHTGTLPRRHREKNHPLTVKAGHVGSWPPANKLPDKIRFQLTSAASRTNKFLQ